VQVGTARAILRGLGLSEDRIGFVVTSLESVGAEQVVSPPAGPEAGAGMASAEPVKFSSVHDRRTLIHLAAQCLYDRSGMPEPRLPLPPGSPFGTVAVGANCTLCMACVAACPSGALSTSGNAPRLLIHESQCHQCGLCEEACPEGAIQLVPRLLCDLTAVEGPVVLRESEPFRCVECGVAFGSPAMIERMTEKLKGHWMYANKRQMRRLRMCATCRARDTLMSEDMKSWNSQ
jgi:ferredoxin